MQGNGLNKDVIYIGRTDYRSAKRLFGIKRIDRRQHTYIVGKTGTGKSTLIKNMVTQDIANGEGLCVVDPHGELVEEILEKIPEERVKDVVYFNPSDIDYHIGFNILEIPDPQYKHLVASGLMGIFTKIWAGVWSARMEYIMNNCVLALLDNPGSTLLGIPRLLVDKEFRQQIISKVQDPVVRAFWVNEYEQWQERFRNEAIAPIQNKVGQFLSTALIRNIVGQSKSTIDIFDIMNSKKIFLVNVSKGRIGEDNSALLGAMLITKIQLAAMERVRIPEHQREDFYLYVDEFQNFATDSFASILSEARKYRLNLIVAHQYIGQLVTDTSTKVRDAIFGNVGTMVAYRVGAADAEFLEKEFEPEFMIQDLVNLPNYHIYLKLMVDGVTCRPFSANILPPFKIKTSDDIVSIITEESRRRYAQPRQQIEEEINHWSGMMSDAMRGGDSSETAEGPGRFPAVCSVCGKAITLPFEPTPGRPVYCKTCLAKVKTGEIAPVRMARPASGAPATAVADKGMTTLASLGIEFEQTPEERPRPQPQGPREDRPPRGDRPQGPQGAQRTPRRDRPITPRVPSADMTEVAPAAPKERVSLSSLKPREATPKQKMPKPEINIDELRQAINQSLQGAVKKEDDDHDIDPKER